VRRRVIIPSIPQVLRLGEALDHFKPGIGDVAMSCRLLACAGKKRSQCSSTA
jgi:hypothetical protein